MTSENKGEIPVTLNLDEWTPMGTFGYRADIYARGNHRVLIDRDSKRVICQYEVGDGRQVDLTDIPECVRSAA